MILNILSYLLLIKTYCAVLKASVEKHKERYGVFPETVEADKIFRSRENILFCKANGIRVSGPALGRPKTNGEREKENASIRNAIEGSLERTNASMGSDVLWRSLTKPADQSLA